MDPYMQKTEALLREGRGRLDRRSMAMRSPAPEFSVLARRRKLMKCEARYSELNRHFELLRSAGTEGLADLKLRLEKACDAFRIEMGGQP